MTIPFVASNGTVIVRKGRASLTVERPGTDRLLNINADRTTALRQFFRAEHDADLGRWRWPENPDYVVYAGGEDYFGRRRAIVINEKTTDKTTFTSAFATGQSEKHQAARAYFEAHPERKPWHDAKSGEAWVLTVDGEEYPWGVGDGVDAGRFVYLGGLSNIPLGHPSITAGRRIWPEDAS